MTDFEVVVVGGGPAGAVAALKCSRLGLKVLLIERQSKGRQKPCGGLLTPKCLKFVKEELGAEVPQEILSSPHSLGLCMVPPSGRRNSRVLKNYELLNVKRNLFDSWLLDLAKESGVEIWEKAWFQALSKSKPLDLSIKKGEEEIRLSTSYLVGADGTLSTVRKTLGRVGNDAVMVLQEYWNGEGDFGDYYYVLYRDSISDFCSYVIPKDGLLVTGVGAKRDSKVALADRSSHLQQWLIEDYFFTPQTLVKRDGGPYPFGKVDLGDGDVVLVGDAAGFCNPLTGEGISFALDSGSKAAEAMNRAKKINRQPLEIYAELSRGSIDYIQKAYQTAMISNDALWENIMKSEKGIL